MKMFAAGTVFLILEAFQNLSPLSPSADVYHAFISYSTRLCQR
jgi:hypothetical protein